MKPFEELLPDYEVKASTENGDEETDKNVELLRKSKLEYIQNYVDNIDNEALKEDNLDKHKLFEVLQKYYNEIAWGIQMRIDIKKIEIHNFMSFGDEVFDFEA